MYHLSLNNKTKKTKTKNKEISNKETKKQKKQTNKDKEHIIKLLCYLSFVNNYLRSIMDYQLLTM